MGVFSFVDEVIEYVQGKSLTASYTLKGSEEFLQDHFSDFPVMPGVLMIESLRQAAALFLSSLNGTENRYRLAQVEGAKFGRFVKPGNKLRILVSFLKKEGNLIFFDGHIDLLNRVSEPRHCKALTARLVLAPLD